MNININFNKHNADDASLPVPNPFLPSKPGFGAGLRIAGVRFLRPQDKSKHKAKTQETYLSCHRRSQC